MEASSVNRLSELMVRLAGAGPKTRVPGPAFLGVAYFQELGDKHHKFPKSAAPSQCFSCCVMITGSRHRFDENTLARTCERYTCRNRKRKVVVVEDGNG